MPEHLGGVLQRQPVDHSQPQWDGQHRKLGAVPGCEHLLHGDAAGLPHSQSLLLGQPPHHRADPRTHPSRANTGRLHPAHERCPKQAPVLEFWQPG